MSISHPCCFIQPLVSSAETAAPPQTPQSLHTGPVHLCQGRCWDRLLLQPKGR